MALFVVRLFVLASRGRVVRGQFQKSGSAAARLTKGASGPEPHSSFIEVFD
jgi:hypothetical protein